MPMARPRWKGKGRAVSGEGPGGQGGIVLPLKMVGNGLYDVAYTIAMRFGASSKELELQVDTGSSDLWVASTSCSSSDCKQTRGRLYDPSSATQASSQFSITYLLGNVTGPILWDIVEVGGYSIDQQAFAGASSVENEALSPDFSGILGLALPLNSVIAGQIPPVVGNRMDGAAWASNLFSISPASASPASRFISLALERPGSDRVPSLLGIGRHPSDLVPNTASIRYVDLANDGLFWEVSVRAITVYVGDVAHPVNVGGSKTGAPFPSAVLDSGLPLIFTASQIANSIYGALGVGPGSDGQYYVPCDTPLNVSITLDDRPPIFLHPLDLTAEPPSDNRAQFCVGLIQAADTTLSASSSSIGDMILGVPFLRNVYTVMAYDIPDDNGAFTQNSTQQVRPSLGLLALTDAATAHDEFHTVRILNKPLASGSSATNAPNIASTNSLPHHISVGIIVLISMLGFFAMCGILFGIRWIFMRRAFRQAPVEELEPHAKREHLLALRETELLGGETLTDSRYALSRLRSDKVLSHMSSGSVRSHLDAVGSEKLTDAEMGYWVRLRKKEPWDTDSDTLIGEASGRHTAHRGDTAHSDGRSGAAVRAHLLSDHRSSMSTPLLDEEAAVELQEDDFGSQPRFSMAGVGSASRRSRVESGSSWRTAGTGGDGFGVGAMYPPLTDDSDSRRYLP